MLTKILHINLPDWLKAVVMAITTPVAGYILTAIQSGSLVIDWHQVGLLAAAGFLGYLVKQLGTSSTIIAVSPTNVPTPIVVTEKTFGITTSPMSVLPIVPLATPPSSNPPA